MPLFPNSKELEMAKFNKSVRKDTVGEKKFLYQKHMTNF